MMEKVPMITLQMESESVPNRRPASIQVIENGVVLYHIQAVVENQKGADGGLYPAVALQQCAVGGPDKGKPIKPPA